METYYTSKYQDVEKLIQKRLKPLGMASKAYGLGRDKAIRALCR